MNIVDKNGDLTKEFFIFMRYNLMPGDDLKVSEKDEKLYNEFINKVKRFKDSFENEDENSKVLAASIFSMFGYSRHYCSMTGQPIIGKFYKINGRVVSKEAYEAHKIVKEIEDFDSKIQKNSEDEEAS